MLFTTQLCSSNTQYNFDAFNMYWRCWTKSRSKENNSCYNFSMCHWNLNSVAAHDLSKLSLLETYNVQRKFHMICLFETYLDSTIQYDDQILTLNGYKTLRAGKLMGVEYICLYITIVTTKLPMVNSTLKLNVLRYMND